MERSDFSSRHRRRNATAALLLGLTLSSCTLVSVHEIGVEDSRGSSRRESRRSADTTFTSAADALSPATRQVLDQRDMTQLWIALPEIVIRALAGIYHADPEPHQLVGVAVAELLLVEAERMDLINPVAARSLYLASAAYAYDYLFAPGSFVARAFDDVFAHMNETYRRATSGFLRVLLTEPGGLRDEFYEIYDEHYQVRVERRGSGRGSGWDPTFFGEIHIADELDVRGFRNRYQQPGFGVPLVGVRENPRVGLLESYYPDGGMIFAVTAVLRFDVDEAPRRGEEALFDDFISTEGQRSAVLSFLNPVSRPTIKIADSAIPLALDTTAPLALQVARSKQLRQASGVGFRDAEEVADLHGLYMHGPYDPQKIPVLMIHGLRSSPLAWLEMTNDLDGDRELRSAYQLWHYFYPTGLPYLYNAATLRQQLNELRRLDPNDTHAALDSMVIVAHSMGGLVSKPLVSSSEKRIWDRFFTVGPEQIVGSPEDVARLVAMTIFEPFAAIDRVIFISTPHRGSPMVNGFIGRLGSNVIRLPEDYSDLFYRLSEANLAVIRPEARKQMTRGGSTSIKALSPQHVALQGLSELPFDPQVKLHTIIGDRDQATGSDTDSDGFVTHESAFLAEAVSELFVPGGHSAYAHPLTILEVKRILKEHLRERSAAADSSR